MTYFISYRHTGAKEPQLGNMQSVIKEAFSSRSESTYSTYYDQEFFDTDGLTNAQIMHHAFNVIDTSDALFVVLDSKKKSEGMLIEVGYCIAKGIPIIVAQHEAVTDTYFPALANTVFTYTDLDDLKNKIINLPL